MSELSKTKKYRIKKLLEVSHLTIKTGNARSFIIENQDFINAVIPSDFITLFDELVKENYSVEELKTCANKVLNIFYTAINNHESVKPEKDSFLYILEQNNAKMEKILDEISPVFKAYNKDKTNNEHRNKLINLFEKLGEFNLHYTIKENVLFPVIEQYASDYRCVQVMWSFHDDIRRNIKNVIEALKNNTDETVDFNRWVGDIFFNMLAIKFREERILFPYILTTIDKKRIEAMIGESMDIGFPYVKPEFVNKKEESETMQNGKVNLGTGTVTIEQIKLIFNHLPVDITYVDENDTVQFFSTPKKRIFPRTTAIIGRKVSNCHPPESVHVVEKIVESFKNGEKDHADFWIKMKGEYILIRYFAVRDSENNYKGVIEVTQEISDIKAIEGEKRLLDW